MYTEAYKASHNAGETLIVIYGWNNGVIYEKPYGSSWTQTETTNDPHIWMELATTEWQAEWMEADDDANGLIAPDEDAPAVSGIGGGADEPVFTVGQEVEIVEHVNYSDLSHGAVITPMREHQVKRAITVIRAVMQDEFEDEHGNLVFEVSYDTPLGTFAAHQLKAV